MYFINVLKLALNSWLIISLFLILACSKAKPVKKPLDPAVAAVVLNIYNLNWQKLLPAPKNTPPPDIDDSYGVGDLGPRILWHHTETLAVMPKRLELVRETVELPSEIKNQLKSAKPVRIFSIKAARPTRNTNYLTSADSSLTMAQNYLWGLGIKDIYDLSPHAHLLTLPNLRASPLNLKLGKNSRAYLSAEQWEQLISDASQRFGIDPKLIAAVIQAESNFNPWAVSHKGAQGAMQIMPATQIALGLKDPFDVKTNVLAGSALLRMLLAKYSKPELALAAYNAGPRAVDKYGGVPPYPETQNYVKKVLKLWQGNSPKEPLQANPSDGLKIEVHIHRQDQKKNSKLEPPKLKPTKLKPKSKRKPKSTGEPKQSENKQGENSKGENNKSENNKGENNQQSKT